MSSDNYLAGNCQNCGEGYQYTPESDCCKECDLIEQEIVKQEKNNEQ